MPVFRDDDSRSLNYLFFIVARLAERKTTERATGTKNSVTDLIFAIYEASDDDRLYSKWRLGEGI